MERAIPKIGSHLEFYKTAIQNNSNEVAMKENALLSIVFMIYREDKYYDLNEVTFICVG